MDPSFWIGSMDHLCGPGQWTHGPPVMDRVHVPLKRKKIKTEKWTINKMQINIVQQYYSFYDKLRDKFWVSQSFCFVTWTQNMDPGSMDPPLWTGSMETFCLRRSWKSKWSLNIMAGFNPQKYCNIRFEGVDNRYLHLLTQHSGLNWRLAYI